MNCNGQEIYMVKSKLQLHARHLTKFLNDESFPCTTKAPLIVPTIAKPDMTEDY